MKIKTLPLCLVVLALATVAPGQTKFSSTALCGKPEPQYAIQVGDQPHHSFVIGQAKCPYTKSGEIAGIQPKEFVATTFTEITGSRATTRGFVDGTMANGDKFQVRSRGTAAGHEGGIETVAGTWRFVSGTGKLKGIRGKGTYSGKSGPEGVTYEIEGDYELPK